MKINKDNDKKDQHMSNDITENPNPSSIDIAEEEKRSSILLNVAEFARRQGSRIKI